jgi:hypothetical protein
LQLSFVGGLTGEYVDFTVAQRAAFTTVADRGMRQQAMRPNSGKVHQALAVGCLHAHRQAPITADADVHRVDSDARARRPVPRREVIRLGPENPDTFRWYRQGALEHLQVLRDGGKRKVERLGQFVDLGRTASRTAVLVEHVKIVAVTLDAPRGRRHVEPCLHTTDQLRHADRKCAAASPGDVRTQSVDLRPAANGRP